MLLAGSPSESPAPRQNEAEQPQLGGLARSEQSQCPGASSSGALYSAVMQGAACCVLRAAWDVLQTLEKSSLSKALSVFQGDIYTVGNFMGLFFITCVIRKLAVECKGLFSTSRAVCSA